MAVLKSVIDLGFGDAGKGITTDFLCKTSNKTLVIRHSGGHQAGHRVVNDDGHSHVFSQIGSGSFRKADTYYSKNCTFYPVAFNREFDSFYEKSQILPNVYVDSLAPVTTFYDVLFNQLSEKHRKHGSCGVGFGSTISRNEDNCTKLYVRDLFSSEQVLLKKLKDISEYYDLLTRAYYGADAVLIEKAEEKERLEAFLESSKFCVSNIKLQHEHELLDLASQYATIVFEGSQGILLDMDHGFFPNVTRAHTTSRNVFDMIKRNMFPTSLKECYYVTRAYQTRHGNGHMTNIDKPVQLLSGEEANVTNEWQGEFRTTMLDLDLLNYSLACDSCYGSYDTKHLVVTCLDKVSEFNVTRNGKIYKINNVVKDLIPLLKTKFKSVILSYSDRSSNMVEVSC